MSSRLRVARSSGFCLGVRHALETAETLLRDEPGADLYMLGEMVHNEEVVSDLLRRGFHLAGGEAECPAGSTVLIRAHGEKPSVLRTLEKKGCRVYDCCCPYVKKIQKLAESYVREGLDVYLAGCRSHPEVVGIVAAGYERVRVLASVEEAEKLIPERESGVLLAQTTFSVEEFRIICKILRSKIANLRIFDTICGTTLARQAEAAELAQDSDLVFVLGSANSSNTAKLCRVCSEFCPEVYLIQRPDQVSALLEGRDLRQLRIGMTAGASTPERMIREVIQVMTENEVFNGGQVEKEERALPVIEETVTEAEAIETDLSQEAGQFEFPEAPAEEAEVSEPETSAEDQTPCAAEAIVSEDTAVAAPALRAVADEMKDISFSDYIDGIAQLKRGMVVKGSVVRYDDEYVYIDVRDKSEGKVPRNEFLGEEDFDLEEAAREHRELDVYVRNIKNTDMGKEIILSKAKVDFTKHKEAIEKAFEEKTPITVKVSNVVKDGVIASYGSVDLYIHRTQLDTQIVEDLESWRGKTIEVLVTQYDPNRKRLRVSGSRRAIVAKERKQRAKDLWTDIEVGKEYDGTVRNLTDFGAFVDIGGVDGLVHVTELSWKRIKHPSEVVLVGDKLRVFVKEFDREKRRISLGYRRPENDPYYNVEERFPVGSIVRGLVVRMFPFGAFVEVAPGVDALCHISQISNYHLNRPDDVLQEMMEVDARVLEVSNEARKISISIKEVEPIDPENPEELLAQRADSRPPRADRGAKQGNKRQRRPRREDEEDSLPTTYVDTPSGSSLSALADFTVASEEGAEVLKQLGLNDSEPVVTEPETAEVLEAVVEERLEEVTEEAEEL